MRTIGVVAIGFAEFFSVGRPSIRVIVWFIAVVFDEGWNVRFVVIDLVLVAFVDDDSVVKHV